MFEPRQNYRIDFVPASNNQISNRFRDTAELLHTYSGLAIDGGRIVSLGDVRTYGTRRGQTVYAAAWLNLDDGESHHGFGRAGGWGYNKSAHAIAGALAAAGVRPELPKGINMPMFVMNEYGIHQTFAAIAAMRGIDPATLRVVENFA
ncbi:MAG: hypothetical protein HDQ88_07010 [Clostridia bacterium]|nr:hypothetical protein [Clostridia bacterium]